MTNCAPALAADVTPDRLSNPEPGNWLMNHRTYDAQRYSTLSQINKGNVKSLKLAYAVANKAFKPGGTNRIILCSDGVANNGITTSAMTVISQDKANKATSTKVSVSTIDSVWTSSVVTACSISGSSAAIRTSYSFFRQIFASSNPMPVEKPVTMRIYAKPY